MINQTIINIPTALIEQLIANGTLKIDGLNNPVTAKVCRMWVSQKVAPAGAISVVVEGNAKYATAAGGEIPVSTVTIGEVGTKHDGNLVNKSCRRLIDELDDKGLANGWFIDDGCVCITVNSYMFSHRLRLMMLDNTEAYALSIIKEFLNWWVTVLTVEQAKRNS